jgi:hypothetical protein
MKYWRYQIPRIQYTSEKSSVLGSGKCRCRGNDDADKNRSQEAKDLNLTGFLGIALYEKKKIYNRKNRHRDELRVVCFNRLDHENQICVKKMTKCCAIVIPRTHLKRSTGGGKVHGPSCTRRQYEHTTTNIILILCKMSSRSMPEAWRLICQNSQKNESCRLTMQ